jgi:magnesium transporter
MMYFGNWIMTTTTKNPIENMEEPLQVSPKNKTWIHLTPKNEEELNKLLRNFDIHPLTVEDILNTNSRVKFEQFPNYTFVVFRGLHFDSNQLVPKNYNIIVTKSTLVTIALDHRNTINDIILDWDKNRHLLQKGIEFIIHRVIDVETDHIMPIVYRIEDQAEELESQVFNPNKRLDINLIFILRANVQQIKKIVNQHIELLKEMEVSTTDFITVESDAFFRDVKDHSYRILDIAENVKDLISSALEVHLTISSRRSNDIMKILTIMTAIMLPMSLIASLYGMNFKHMPFLELQHGFYISIGTMFTIAALMFSYFKFRNWF